MKSEVLTMPDTLHKSPEFAPPGPRQAHLVSYRERPGYDALWSWFGLTRASWLTLPRVLLHEMPDEWQARLADLLWQFDMEWDTGELPSTRVQAIEGSGRLTRFPEWLLQYRHPHREAIEASRRAAP
jgi:hypothetical protein